jgi:uncharacterized membrane protein
VQGNEYTECDRRIGQRHLEIGNHRDRDGKLRLVIPFPTWDDLVRLAFDEICFYGATSVQVMRRMNALVADLMQAVPEERPGWSSSFRGDATAAPRRRSVAA